MYDDIVYVTTVVQFFENFAGGPVFPFATTRIRTPSDRTSRPAMENLLSRIEHETTASAKVTTTITARGLMSSNR